MKNLRKFFNALETTKSKKSEAKSNLDSKQKEFQKDEFHAEIKSKEESANKLEQQIVNLKSEIKSTDELLEGCINKHDPQAKKDESEEMSDKSLKKFIKEIDEESTLQKKQEIAKKLR